MIDEGAIAAIESEILANAAQLYSLGRNHYLFATRQNNRAWRQKISRFYYAAFNISRAIRLCVAGDYATDVTDHKKIECLPDDFPNKSRYSNQLSVLREDRNLCDYDHTAKLTDLVVGVAETNELVEQFMDEARGYLRQRGVAL